MSSQSKGRSAGVLPVNAAARKHAAAQSATKSSQRSPAPRLRLIVRRLPPGLTENEFWTVLGDEWRAGKGKVDWAAYKEGKVSKDPAKPSRPARAYLRVKDQSLLDTLSQIVKESSFQDAKNTTKDTCLVGPPSLEFAPYNKTPSGRARQDGRQGTIDQDQEFIDFLQSLTEPITKSVANGTDSTEAKVEANTVTPLVQYIKEKKANKAKEAAQAKAAKSASKETKPVKNERPPAVIIKGKAAPTAAEKEKEKERVAKATQDAVKAVQKTVGALQGKQVTPSPKNDPKQPAAKETTTQAPPAQQNKQERSREPRDNARGAARMLQRDLGLLAKGNTSPRNPKATPAATATAGQSATPSGPKVATPTTTTKSSETAASQHKPSIVASPTTPSGPPTGPRASRTPSAASTASTKQPSAAPSVATPAQPQAQHRQNKPQAMPPQPSPGAKSAFLKHANPSQGITEELLKEAFTGFGVITRCEIDKKKGLGYVDFAEHDGLKKAMASSPIKVANGQVVVLENKSQQGKRGGAGAGNNQASTAQKTPITSAASSPAIAKATPNPIPAVAIANSPNAASTAQATTTQAPSTPSTPSTPATPATSVAAAGVTPPTEPRGTPRGGHRGGGGNPRAPSRGGGQGPAQSQSQNAGQGPGQGGRQGYRGGRGNFRGGGRGAGASVPNSPVATTATVAGGASSAASQSATPTAAAAAKDEAKKP